VSKLTQPIKWHGGKHYLAEWIISLMPPHLHYVEPFFGGGSVLLTRDPALDWMLTPEGSLPSFLKGCSEVVNDVNRELTNFWQVLRDPELYPQFRQVLELTPFSQIEWEESESRLQSTDPVEAAAAFFIRARMCRQGIAKSFATLSRNRTRRRMNEQVSSYLTAVEGLQEVHQRLRNVVILNDDACTVIKKQDGYNTLFYCDPPYVHETRATVNAYEFEMDLEHHQRLLETLAQVAGKFMLSGYRCSLYDEFAEKHGWRREDKLIDNKASRAKVKEKKCECLWMNFAAEETTTNGVPTFNS